MPQFVLFGGLPGPPELSVILLLGLVVVVLPAYFVYNDATERGENATLWTVATVLGGLVGNIIGAALVVVLYLAVTRD